MILRVSLGCQTDLDGFVTRFVEGGLIHTRINPISSLAPTGGNPRRRRVETPVRRARRPRRRGLPRPRGLFPRWTPRLFPRWTHRLQLGYVPNVLRVNTRPHRRERRRWALRLGLFGRPWARLSRLGGWPTPAASVWGSRRVAAGVGYLRGYARATARVRLGRYVKDYDIDLRGRYRRWQAARVVRRYRRGGGVAGRWCSEWHPTGGWSPLLVRRSWFRPCPGLTALRPPLGSSPVESRMEALAGRLGRLARRHRHARVLRWRAVRQARHTRWVFKKMAKATPRLYKRYHRGVRRRIRRRLAHPVRVYKYLRRTVRSGWFRYRIHRPALLEVNRLVLPEGYLSLVERLRGITRKQAVVTPLDYTRFTDLPRQLDLQRRRVGRHRRYKLRDHPVWGELLDRVYRVRWDWLHTGPVLAVAHRNRIDPKLRHPPPYNEVNHPGAHPLQSGPWSWLYWSTTRWGRGSYWRTKPVGRAKRVFVEAVASGYTVEVEVRNWYAAGAGAARLRSGSAAEGELLDQGVVLLVGPAGLPVEVVVGPPQPESPPPVPPEVAPFVWPPAPDPVLTVAPTAAVEDEGPVRRWPSWSEWVATQRSAQLVEALTEGFPNVGAYPGRRVRWWWNVSNVVGHLVQAGCTLVNVVWLAVAVPGWCAWRGVRPAARFVVRRVSNVYRWGWYLRDECSQVQQHTLRRWLIHSRPVRRFRWAYHAFMHVYASDDFLDEALNPEVDVELANWVEDEEEDLAADYGEELESEGTYWNGFHPDEGDEWWDADLEDYLDEANEVMADLVFEEAPHYVRLWTRPFTDVLVRLPVWGVAEAIALGAVWLKREWQLAWARLLVRPGWTPTVAVALRRVLHLGVWVGVYTWGVNLITPDELHLWVTYTCGLTFHEEYYLGWVALVLLGTTWVVGPYPLREYLYRELGPENVGFTFLAGVVLATPEEYYPQRPLSDPQRAYLDRTLGHWSWKPLRKWPTQHHYHGGHGSTYPIFRYDDLQQVVANFNDIHEWPEIDFTDKDPTLWLAPDRAEHEDNHPGYPWSDETAENHFWDRHPVYYRNNYMRLNEQDQWWEHDCFEPYLRDELDDAPRNEGMYHQINTRDHSGHQVVYPPVTRPSEYTGRPFE